MILNFLRTAFSKYKYISLSKKSILGLNIYLSKHSYIYINDGSTKKDIKINDNVMMCGKLYSQNGGKITIDEYSSIRHNSVVWSSNNIQIGKYVIISDHVVISDNNSHPIEPEKRKEMILSGWSTKLWKWNNSTSSAIIIEDNVWIGKDSKILKGVTIGENSIVAIGAVVVKDVPKNVIVAGNPAKIVKNIDV